MCWPALFSRRNDQDIKYVVIINNALRINHALCIGMYSLIIDLSSHMLASFFICILSAVSFRSKSLLKTL